MDLGTSLTSCPCPQKWLGRTGICTSSQRSSSIPVCQKHLLAFCDESNLNTQFVWEIEQLHGTVRMLFALLPTARESSDHHSTSVTFHTARRTRLTSHRCNIECVRRKHAFYLLRTG